MSSNQMTVPQQFMFTELIEHIDAMLQTGQMTAQQAADVLKKVAAILQRGRGDGQK